VSSGVFTAPASGIYKASTSVGVDLGPGGATVNGALLFLVNGLDINKGASMSTNSTSFGLRTFGQMEALLRLNAGDQVKVNARQVSGATRSASVYSSFSIHRIGL